MHLMNVTGLTDGDPDSGVQFAVLDPDGTHHAYGDQRWVAYGGAVEAAHPGSKTQRRTVTITYGDWTDHD